MELFEALIATLATVYLTCIAPVLQLVLELVHLSPQTLHLAALGPGAARRRAAARRRPPPLKLPPQLAHLALQAPGIYRAVSEGVYFYVMITIKTCFDLSSRPLVF